MNVSVELWVVAHDVCRDVGFARISAGGLGNVTDG